MIRPHREERWGEGTSNLAADDGGALQEGLLAQKQGFLRLTSFQASMCSAADDP